MDLDPHDLLPDDAQILADEVNDALLARRRGEGRARHRRFQDRVITALNANFEFANSRRNSAATLAQIGTPRP